MKIAIDLSPLKKGNFLQHRVRGTGFYLENLKESLKKHFPNNEYLYFSKGEKIPVADVVHFPFFEPFFRSLPFNLPKKSVITVHDLIPFVFPSHFPSGIKGNINWKVQKRALQKASAIITDSESSKNDIHKFTGIPMDRIHAIYLAAAPHFKVLKDGNWREEILKKYNLPQKFALYVGDITWNKNLPNIIRAAKESKINLVIVGKAFEEADFDHSNPWNQDILESQKLAKESDLVKGLGFVPDEDLVYIYNLATVFVMPSRYEGFGLPIIEAMQSGCAVVSSDRGSLAEIAKDSALIVDPERVESIRDGIKKVFGDEALRQDLIKKGIEKAKEFDWKKTAGDTMKVYENIQ